METWKRSPNTALSMQWYEGKLQWRLHPHSWSKDELEFGGDISRALEAENKGRGWHREDAIVSRAVKAVSTLGFADFLQS